MAHTRLPHRAVRTTGGTHLSMLLDGKNSEDSERIRRIHREFSLSQSQKTFHDAVAFVLEAQPPMGEEHELQHRRECVKTVDYPMMNITAVMYAAILTILMSS